MSALVAPAAKLPSTGVLVPALLGALAVVALLVVLMRRRADAFPLLAILALPFRLPIAAQGRTVYLLIPLYLVVAAGTLAHLMPRALAWLRASQSPGEAPPAAPGASPRGALHERDEVSLRRPSSWLSPRGLELVLFTAIALYAVQATYSSDLAKAATNVAFFYVPFALLFLLLRQTRWTPQLLARSLQVAVALAVLAFIARRLESEPVAVVAAVRSGHVTPFEDGRLPTFVGGPGKSGRVDRIEPERTGARASGDDAGGKATNQEPETRYGAHV